MKPAPTPKALTPVMRKLAEATARVIAKAAELGLPDAPSQLVSPVAIYVLARAHVDLLDREEQAPPLFTLEQARFVRSALESACNGARAQGVPLNGATGFDGSAEVLDAEIVRLEAADRVQAAAARAANDAAADPLVTLYHRVMGNTIDFAHPTFIVRQWDGMDGCWCDCTGDVSRYTALRDWAARTGNGTRNTTYADLTYFAIFPGGTRMHWDGADGREMHR